MSGGMGEAESHPPVRDQPGRAELGLVQMMSLNYPHTMSTDIEAPISRRDYWSGWVVFFIMPLVGYLFSPWHALVVICGGGIIEIAHKWAMKRRREAEGVAALWG